MNKLLAALVAGLFAVGAFAVWSAAPVFVHANWSDWHGGVRSRGL